MTQKQFKYFKLRIENPEKTKKDCALEAGYSTSVAENAKEVIENRLDDPSMIQAMERKGLNEQYLTTILQQGLQAKSTTFAKFQGTIMDQRETIDYTTRAKYLDIALKLRSAYPANDLNVKHSGEVNTQVNPFDGISLELKEYIMKLIEADNNAESDDK